MALGVIKEKVDGEGQRASEDADQFGAEHRASEEQLRITRKGADFGSVVRHPAAVERIGAIHRKAQAVLNAISRKLDPNLHKKR